MRQKPNQAECRSGGSRWRLLVLRRIGLHDRCRATALIRNMQKIRNQRIFVSPLVVSVSRRSACGSNLVLGKYFVSLVRGIRFDKPYTTEALAVTTETP